MSNAWEKTIQDAPAAGTSDWEKTISKAPSIMDQLLSKVQPAIDAGNSIYDNNIKPGQDQLLDSVTGGFLPKIEGAVSMVGRAAGLGNAGQALKEQILSGAKGPLGPTMNAINGKTLDFLPPTLDMDTLGKAYEDAKKHSQDELSSDFDKAPIPSMVGNVMGAVVSPINKILPGAGSTGLVAAMKTGAAAAGLNGLAKADLANPMDAAADITTDAGVGAAATAALGLVGKGVAKSAGALANSSIGKAISGTDSMQKMGEILKTSYGGKNLQGKEVTESLNNELGDRAADIVNYGKGKLLQASKQYSEVLNPMTMENVRPTQEALESLAKEIQQGPNGKALQGVSEKLRDLSAGADVYTHAQIQDEFLGPIEQQLKALYGDKVGAVKLAQIENTIYSNNPVLANAKNAVASNYAEQKTLMNTMGVDPSAITSQAVKKENIATNNLTQSLRSSDKPGSTQFDKIATLKDLLGDSPEMLSKLDQSQGLAKDLSINKSLREAPSVWSGLGYNAANVTGLAVGGIKNAAGNAMSNVDNIGKVSGKLKGTALGNKLDSILQLKPEAQSRAIFTLSQQPWFRKLSEDEQK